MSVMFASITTNGTTVETSATTSSSDDNTQISSSSTTIEPVATGTIIFSGDYWYWNSLYYFYAFLLLLVCLGLALAGLSRSRRVTSQQRARLRAQANGTTCSTPNEPASNGTTISTFDNPPTYENAMANYIEAKQHLRAMEEGAVNNARAMTASTTTIETCVTEVAASHTDLSTSTASATNQGNASTRSALP